MAGRTFTRISPHTGLSVYRESDLLSKEVEFTIGDGVAWYKVVKIGGGDNPIVTLRRMDDDSRTYEGYGEPEKFIRASELVARLDFAALLDAANAQATARSKRSGKDVPR